jgi:hypothetical protein
MGKAVPDEDRQQVIAHLNLALTELHKRFWLSSKELFVKLYPHIQIYHLDKEYAIQNKLSVQVPKYIIDSVYAPFDNDLLKIEIIFNECGECVPLNDRTDPKSLYTPQWNSVQVPLPYKDSSILVQYRADHPRIEWTPTLEPKNVQVNVPMGLMEPLCLFIGHRAYRALNSDGGQESMNYLQQFEAACTRAIDAGLQVTSNTTNLKLDHHGWI